MNDLYQWGGWLIATILSITFVIKFVIKFDFNKWLENRREQKKEEMFNMCPHAVLVKINGKQAVYSCYHPIEGSKGYQCEKCEDVKYDKKLIDMQCEYWTKNSEELSKRIKKINKLAKKFQA